MVVQGDIISSCSKTPHPDICKAASMEVAATLLSKSGGGQRLFSDKLFPTWVMGADRKLLHSSTVAADIVVAKDGSGNYKTISEAVSASVKLRNGTKRFVIHVKAAVYSENVEITESMKNLTFIGDGIDSTIVTGSKNVHDGSSTFNSSTFVNNEVIDIEVVITGSVMISFHFERENIHVLPFQTVHEGRIYQLKLFCDKDYPDIPPTVKFQTRINMACVNEDTGVIEPALFPMLADWRREHTMEDELVQLKKEMSSTQNRKLVQPPDGNSSSDSF
ncbi:hypothetical protein MRB53_029983 [Persea americana]|uniref:Uncharacterized protein n=1 Tax=Persea americana TaxID=3435 RepID=A0ACC2KJV2_PERAE|nr:hypothetical protein MRB53_029983 [Persea americana]